VPNPLSRREREGVRGAYPLSPRERDGVRGQLFTTATESRALS